MARYPKINYIGNKAKLTDWIMDKFPIKNGTVVDLFSGGASVSYALKEKGFTVYSNDILYSNFVISKAIIENQNVKLKENVFDIEISKDDVMSQFNRIQFLVNNLYYEQEVIELARLLCINSKLQGYERYLYLALLRRAMIRKLPYSRMNVAWNQIVKLRDEEYSYQKYGRKRAYQNESFESHMKSNIDNLNESVFNNKNNNLSFNMDAMEMLKRIEKVDAIYLDPPYPSTMNNYDAFYGQFDKMLGKGIDTHMDLTCKNCFLQNMKYLFEECMNKSNYLVLSMNNKSNDIVSQIKKELRNYGEIQEYSVSHNYQITGAENKKANTEILLVLKRG